MGPEKDISGAIKLFPVIILVRKLIIFPILDFSAIDNSTKTVEKNDGKRSRNFFFIYPFDHKWLLQLAMMIIDGCCWPNC